MLDLRTLSDYNHELFELGDIITIQDEELGKGVKVRLIYHSYDVLQPWKCSIKLGDPLPSAFSDLASSTRRVELIYGDAKFIIKNFDSKNDRNSSTPRDPVIADNGSAVDHTEPYTDGSCDISFEWAFDDSGDEGRIDGFLVYLHTDTSDTPYRFSDADQPYQSFPSSQRHIILKGQPADLYYTFGIRAYRIVDEDIHPDRVLYSQIVQPTHASEDPYRPMANIAFAGDVTGTINGVPVTVLLDDLGTALQEIADLHDEIDGSISTWLYEYAPTTENYPASEWTTEELKAEHLGDLFTDLTTGYSYRWVVQGTTYTWLRITDSDVAKALADAAEALNTANSKRRVFLAQPEPPYDVGDLWRIAGSPDFKICVNSKEAEQYYHADDWVFATNAKDYTDQGLAALNTLVQQAQAAADDAQATADGKVTTFWLPSTETPTAEESATCGLSPTRGTRSRDGTAHSGGTLRTQASDKLSRRRRVLRRRRTGRLLRSSRRARQRPPQ